MAFTSEEISTQSSVIKSDRSNQLIKGLDSIPLEWALTPVNGKKQPYRKNWQTENPLSREQIIEEIKSGQAKGYGLRTGRISGGIVAIDADGHAAHDKINELSGGVPRLETVAFTSNKPGRCQYLFYVPQEYWDEIATKKISTGVKGDDGKEQKLELRWDGCQSVLPPSVHPETGFYRWRISSQEVAIGEKHTTYGIAPAPKWLIEQMQTDSRKSYETSQLPRTPSIPDDVPLYQFLTKDDRTLIHQGAAQGSRNDSGAKLARNLIGTAQRLNHLGIRYSGDSRQLFDDYCHCCTPALATKEAEAIWKSAQKDNPTPSLSDGALENCAKAWSRNQEKSSGRSFNGGIGSGGGNRRGNGGSNGSGGDGGDGGDDEQPLVELNLRDPVLEIINRNQDRSHRDEAFIKLAQITGATTREIKELAASLETEIDLEESRSDRKTEVENLLRIGKYQLELQDYLDPSVARPLERVAGWMGTTPAAMLTTLYSVIGSLLQVETRLELIEATDFYAVPVVYTGLVCESGGGKSPAQKTIINPLFALQNEAEIEYKERLLDYQQQLSEWKKIKDNEEPPPKQPVPHEYYTTDATSEAIALIQSQQPNHGFLGWFDELPALFKSQGQYKNGRGADGEKILSGRDGTGFKVNRASGKRLVVSQSAYSITGALQPSILRQMMGDFTDANGQWARFLWTVMQVQPAPYPDDAIPFDLSGLLKGIYRRISKLTPQTYKLSPEAKKLYRNWYNELDQLKMSESRQGLRAVYSKMKGDTGVLALLLHCFNGCVKEGSIPDQEVSQQTMVAAIKLAKYHIGQVKLIHSEGDVANGDLVAIHTKIIQLSEREGWLKAADVRDIDRHTKKQFSANDIRRHFQELETLGFGQTKGDGTRLMWSIYKEGGSPTTGTNSGQTQDNSGHNHKNTGSASIIDVQPFVENNSGQTQDNSGQTQDNIKSTGSAAVMDVQQSPIKTQDTQDSFGVAQTNLVDAPDTGNEQDLRNWHSASALI
jgi:hypothetical protein